MKALERPEVRGFVDFYLKEGVPLVREVGYIPLTDTRIRAGAQPVHRQEDRVDVRRHGSQQPGDARTAAVEDSSSCSFARRASRRVRHRADAVSLRGRLDSGHGRHRPGAAVRDGGVPARGADHRVPVRHRLDAALFRQALRRAAARRRHAADIRDRDGRRAAGRPSDRDLPERVRHRPGAAHRAAGAGGPGRRADRRVRLLRAAVRHAAAAVVRARPRRLQRAEPRHRHGHHDPAARLVAVRGRAPQRAERAARRRVRAGRDAHAGVAARRRAGGVLGNFRRGHSRDVARDRRNDDRRDRRRPAAAADARSARAGRDDDRLHRAGEPRRHAGRHARVPDDLRRRHAAVPQHLHRSTWSRSGCGTGSARNTHEPRCRSTSPPWRRGARCVTSAIGCSAPSACWRCCSRWSRSRR